MRSKNRNRAPADIIQARSMSRIRAIDAAIIWGLEPATISRRCNRGEGPGAVKLNRIWYVTPAGMERMFDPKRR